MSRRKKDPRKSQRKRPPEKLRATITIVETLSFDVQIEDVSCIGAGILSARHVEIGTELCFSTTLLIGRTLRPIEADGVVRRVELRKKANPAAPDLYYIGIEFTEISGHHGALLLQYTEDNKESSVKKR